MRKIIYTTNAAEGFHRQIQKVTKTKGAFTNDMSLLNLSTGYKKHRGNRLPHYIIEALRSSNFILNMGAG
ncbi:hypothetical protein [Salegentibacter lacus]